MWTARGVIVVLGALLTASCGSGRTQNVRAPTDLACGAGQLKTTKLMEDADLVEGCGKSDVYLWDYPQKKWVSLRDRAAFDLGCPKEEIQVQLLDTTTYGATGCKHRATYKHVWLHGFLMNSADGSKTAPSP